MRYSLFFVFSFVLSGVFGQLEFSYNGQVLDQSAVQQIEVMDQVPIDVFVHNLAPDTAEWFVGQCLLLDDPNIDQGALLWESHSTWFGIGIPPSVLTYPCWDLQTNAAFVYPGDSVQLRLYFDVNGAGCETYRFKIIENGVYIDSIDFSLCTNLANIGEHTNEKGVYYPNPSSGEITVASEIEKVQVYNSLGTLVKEVTMESDGNTLEFGELSNGVYSIRFWDNAGNAFVQELVLKK